MQKLSAVELGLEPHFSVGEIAALWGLSRQTITRLFNDAPGVLKFGPNESRFTRQHQTLRLPESVVARVHREHRIM